MNNLTIFGGVVLAIIIIRFFWRAYLHPASVLGRQAANMNWIAVGRVADGEYRNVKLNRDGEVAIISYRNRNVELLRPNGNKVFQDFLELEHWLVKQSSRPYAEISNAPKNHTSAADNKVERDFEVVPSNAELDSLHVALDEMKYRLKPHIRAIDERFSDEKISLLAELMSYCATYSAKKILKVDISSLFWNSFITSIENRIISNRRTKPNLSGEVLHQSGNREFVNYASEFNVVIGQLEKLINEDFSPERPTAVARILNFLGVETVGLSPTALNEFQAVYNFCIGLSAREIVPRISD